MRVPEMRREGRIQCFCILLVMLLGPTVALAGFRNGTHSTLPEPSQTETISADVGNILSLGFHENIGQISNREVRFYTRTSGLIVGFGEGKVLLSDSENVVVLSFVGAEQVFPREVNLLSSAMNYIFGDRGTFANIRTYESLVYDNLWTGIGLVCKSAPTGVSLEFHLSPGADYRSIRIQYEGCHHLNMESNRLEIVTHVGASMHQALEADQGHDQVDMTYITRGRRTLGFQASSYERSMNVIIRLTMYSSYLGSSLYDRGDHIAVDDSGNTYITGYTESPSFPTFNSNSELSKGDVDCFIFKLNSTGNGLVYSTFIGGTAVDRTWSIAVDNQGNSYVTGSTISSDFPTLNAFDSSYNGNGDCFVLKLNSTGNGLSYSTYVGGSESDWAESIEVDTSGMAYVVGYTASSSFPVTDGYDGFHNGGKDCFILKLGPTGDALLHSTFLGGSSNDHGYSIAVDGSGCAYVTGFTESSDFPTYNGYSLTHNGGTRDCFVCKLSGDWTSLEYSTFLGGSSEDKGTAIIVDNLGNAYLTGQTESSDFPTINAFSNTHHEGHQDGFVAKLSSTGDILVFSTFIGGTNDDYPNSIEVDSRASVFVGGYTESPDFPIANAFDDSYNGEYDCFIFKLSPSGESLYYSTYIGGINNDYSNSIAIDSSGNVYITGQTSSSDFPVVDGYDTTFNGGFADVFVFKLPDMGDSDTDGLADFLEDELGTDKYNNDTDGDGLSDGDEVSLFNTDPHNTDSDNDMLSDAEEVSIYGTDPNDCDTDNDLMIDGWEVQYGLDPLSDDASEDPDSDGLTNLEEQRAGTDPMNSDSDGDGLIDGWEIANGYNALDPLVPLDELLAYHANTLGVVALVVGATGAIYVLALKHERARWRRREIEKEKAVQEALQELGEAEEEPAKRPE